MVRHRGVGSVLVGAAVACASLCPGQVLAQATQGTSRVAKSTAVKGPAVATTPWGDPDLQGVWDYRTITPLERPSALAGKQVFTDEEAAEFEREQNRRQNRDLVDPTKGGAGYAPQSQGGVVPYNEFWYDRGNTIVGTKRTSLISDPADGLIPYVRRPAVGLSAGEGGGGAERGSDSWEDRSLWERCLTRELPRLSGAYNNNLQIFQSADHVVILNEMIHEARLVPLGGKPHLPASIQQWQGDSRGHWEGKTLVVETTNFGERTAFRGSRSKLHLVERFTRIGPDSLQYEFTVDDPTVWTRPWTAGQPMKKGEGEVYEYACHEGNRGMVNLLAGARAMERAAGARKQGTE